MVNDVQTHDAVTESLEHISGLITHYAMIEALYLRTPSSAVDQLVESLVRLYTAILEYLLKAKRYFSRNTGGIVLLLDVQSSMADMMFESALPEVLYRLLK
jgi:hypothetical protein